MRLRNTAKIVAALSFVAAVGLASAQTYHRSFRNGYPSGAQGVTSASPRAAGVSAGVSPAKSPAPKSAQDASDFSKFRDKTFVTGVGKVTKILSDDTVPPCHQRFFLADGAGNTVLVAHNIDESPRVANLAVGDTVAFKGEFVDHKKGGLVHFTHPDKSHRKPGGWVKKVEK